MEASVFPSHVFRAAARRMLLDRPLEGLARRASRTWSATEVLAEVVAIRDEGPRAKTLVLAPNGRWGGFRAGQYVPVTFEVNGVRTVRCYSLSSAPHEGSRLELTVARHPQGKVSGFVHDRLRVGAVVTLGEAAGDLTLPEKPGPVLLLAGGSGITPMRSHVRALAARGALGRTVLLHDARDEGALVFADEFRAFCNEHPGFVYLPRTTNGDDPNARLDAARLAALVPDFATRTALACGPGGFTAAVARIFAEAGAEARLTTESFTPHAATPTSLEAAAGAEVTLARCGKRFASDGRRNLLVQAEEAGARPKSGCRMGICRTCTCTKTRGAVVNLLTGQVSAEPNEAIQLCVSAALSEVELDI
jgi:ferredoxin-NADP reductase